MHGQRAGQGRWFGRAPARWACGKMRDCKTCVIARPDPEPQGRHLDVHREPDGTRYTHQFRASDLSRIELAALPGLVLDLRGLF